VTTNQGVSTQRKPSAQNLTTIQEVSFTRQMTNVQQPAQKGDSERTVESLVDPLRRMSIRRLSRKPTLINDSAVSQSMNNMPSSQHRVSFAFTNNNASPKVVDVCADNERDILNTKESNNQQNTNNLTSTATLKMRRLTQITNQIPIRLSNGDQTNSSTSAVRTYKEVGSPRNDDLLTLAASIPLPQSPVETKEKVGLTKESYNNNDFSSDIEKARLYEELEELEKQLEQEISEDMSEIL